jgi:branched-chain amino acid transport system substrate-binding protein
MKWATAAALLGATAVVGLGAGCIGDNEPITIGAVASQRAANAAGGPNGGAGGGAGGAGGDMRHGIELAIDELNAAGGVRGRPLRVVFRDDSGTTEGAMATAQAFVDDRQVVAVIGHGGSAATLAAAPIYDGRLVAISPSSTAPDLTGRSPWIFRVVPSDSSTGRTLARYMSAHGHRRAAVLYQNTTYGRGLAAAFRHGFDGSVVSSDPIDATVSSAEPYVTYLRRLPTPPDVIFIAGDAAIARSVLHEVQQQRMVVDIAGSDAMSGLARDSAALAEGAYAAIAFTNADTRPAVRQFLAAYQARFGRPPIPSAALSYDATRLIAAAVNAAGPSRSGVRRYLAQLDSAHAFAGVTGAIHFRGGDPVGKTLVIARITHGALVVADSTRP